MSKSYQSPAQSSAPRSQAGRGPSPSGPAAESSGTGQGNQQQVDALRSSGDLTSSEGAGNGEEMCSVGGGGEAFSAGEDEAGVCTDYYLVLLDAIHAGSAGQARDAVAQLDPEQRQAAGEDVEVLGNIPLFFDLDVTLDLYGTLGCNLWQELFAYGLELILEHCNQMHPGLLAVLQTNQASLSLIAPFLPDNASIALFGAAYDYPLLEQLAVAGFDALGNQCGTAEPDYDLLIRILDFCPQGERQGVLLGMRQQGYWESMIAALGAEHVVLIQGWLDEDAGDGTNKTLEERIAAAHNSARGQSALAALDGLCIMDVHNRITGRLRELLVLGVALPKLDGEALSEEGVLSLAQVRRAGQALMWMPDQEYIRLSLLLELTGDQSRLTQSFLLLEAVAARADEFTLADAMLGTSGDLTDLESFSDTTRDMNQQTLVQQTSVTQTRAGQGPGNTQHFTDSCGPTSVETMRAEADPVEALRMNQERELGQDALGGYTALEQEQSLERHNGQTAAARNPAAITNAVQGAYGAAGLSGAEQTAINDYLEGKAYTAADFTSGTAKLRTQMGDTYPGDQALRLVRETVSVSRQQTIGQVTAALGGLTATEQLAVVSFLNGAAYNNADYATGIAKVQANMGGTFPGAARLQEVRDSAGVGTGTTVGMTPTQLVGEGNSQLNVDDVTGRTMEDNFDNVLWNLWVSPAINRSVPTMQANAAYAGRVTTLLNTAYGRVDEGYDQSIIVYWNGGGGHFMTFTNVRTVGGVRQFLLHDPWTGNTTWLTQATIIAGNWPIGSGILCGLQG